MDVQVATMSTGAAAVLAASDCGRLPVERKTGALRPECRTCGGCPAARLMIALEAAAGAAPRN
jgi:hypothetical protein